MKKYAIIVAGGTGQRMGSSVPKQFLLLRGRPVLAHTIDVFLCALADLKVVLVLPEAHLGMGAELVAACADPARVTVTAGGGTRFHSVKKGLELVRDGRLLKGGAIGEVGSDGEDGSVGGGDPIIGVHDGVRCLLTPGLVRACYEAAAQFGSAIPVTDARDSLRLLGPEGGNTSIDRSRVKLVQTPQTFLSSVLIPAYEADYSDAYTDDASVVEAAGKTVHLVEGEVNNIKITTPIDLVIAEQLLAVKKA